MGKSDKYKLIEFEKKLEQLQQENEELRNKLSKCKEILTTKTSKEVKTKDVNILKQLKVQPPEWNQSVWPNIPYKCPCRIKHNGILPPQCLYYGTCDCCPRHGCCHNINRFRKCY